MPAQVAVSDGLHKCKWRSYNSLWRSQQHSQCKLQNVRTNIIKAAGTTSHLCNGRIWGSQFCHCARCKLLLQPAPMHGLPTDSSIVVPSSPGCTMHMLMALSLELKHKYVATDAHTFRKSHFTVHYHSDTEWLPYPSCNTGHSMIVLLDNLSGMQVSPFYCNLFSCFVSF